jgi:DNA helicase II / ATP-dependent DNA helicase PcrA
LLTPAACAEKPQWPVSELACPGAARRLAYLALFSPRPDAALDPLAPHSPQAAPAEGQAAAQPDAGPAQAAPGPGPAAGGAALSPEQAARAEHLERVLQKSGGAWPGHLRLLAAGHDRDVLLGAGSRSAPVVAIDWQTAPLAQVFFETDEGGDYEVEIDHRSITGTLQNKSLLAFEGGRIAEVQAPGYLLRREGGPLRSYARPQPGLMLPRPEQLRRQQPWQVRLDPAQEKLVSLPAGEPLLLLGEAGFGKTTVALHRLVRLRTKNPDLRAGVIVPTEGLRTLTANLLERMGHGDVPVFRFDQWASRVARLAFAQLPRRESQWASAGVIKFKRHPALRAAIELLVQQRRKKPRSMRRELEHLFGDSAILAKALAAAQGTLQPGLVQEVLEHTHIQFGQGADKEYRHVTELERLETLDGRGLDDDTPLADTGTLDAEDYAVLFELDRIRALRTGAAPARVEAWDCLVIDEAQEFAPLELALIGRAARKGGSLVVAGDAAQQLDDGAAFQGWPAVMQELLGTQEHAREPRQGTLFGGKAAGRGYTEGVLHINYRCPPEVTALARPLRDPSLPAAHAAGPGIARIQHKSDLHVAVWLCEELRLLRERDPGATIAVICRGPEKAERLARVLGHAVDARLALDGRFDFRAGISVTCVAEVKGLEFDHVVLPDASAASYPDAAESRRALYVAVTRACHQLILATPGKPSPLLGP